MAVKKLRLIDRLRRTKVYSPGMHKPRLNRLNWEQIEARPMKEGGNVVKGTSKRIVVVKSPDPKVFEQAIFIVKEDFLGRCGRTDALREAQQVANAYIRSAVATPRRLFQRLPPLAWAGIGIALAGIIGLLVHFFI